MPSGLALACIRSSVSLGVPTQHVLERFKHLMNILTITVPRWIGTAHGHGREPCKKCPLSHHKGQNVVCSW